MAVQGINLRDLGTGGRVQQGKVLRSAAPVFFTKEDLAKLEEYLGEGGIVLDLRTAGERAHYADREKVRDASSLFAGQSRNKHVDLASPSVRKAACAKATYLSLIYWAILYVIGYKMLVVAKTVEVLDLHNGGLRVLYATFLDHGKSAVGSSIVSIAEVLEKDGRVVVHCTVGKDRTGVISALLLLLCGVPHATIIDDYHKSEANLAANRHIVASQSSSLHKVVPVSVLRDAPKDAMQHVIDIVEGYGGIRTYLSQECGVPEASLETILKKLRC